MAYDLRAFNRTWYSRAGQSSSAILQKYPYLCSREALVQTFKNNDHENDTAANPYGYTAEQLADIIIDRFDQIMYDTWFDSTVYHPKSLQGSINAGYRWDQAAFWDNFNTHFIFNDGGTDADAMYALDHVEVVLLPKFYNTVNSAEYYRKPYLGFDQQMITSEFGAELDLDGSNRVSGLTNALVDAGSFVTGVEYNIREVGDTDFTLIGAANNNVNTVFTATGPGTGTGKARETAGLLVDHGPSPIPGGDAHASLMFVYDANYYHPDFQPNGTNSSHYSGDDPADWSTFPSSKRYDRNIAIFEVTVSGGKVTAITGEETIDGDLNSITGGWGYGTFDDYKELSFASAISYTNGTQQQPRVLYRTTQDAVGYTGNRATVDINSSASEFYAGSGLTDGTYSAWAMRGGVGRGHQIEPDVNVDYTNWYDINLPTHILPKMVRIAHERPVLKSTTRSLKEISVGTGAHRTSWEFEYPPMTYAEAKHFIDFFEATKGGQKPCQIYVPSTAMPHTESVFYNVPVSKVAVVSRIIDGDLIGSDTLVLDGFGPGETIPDGTYFNLGNKAYRILDCTNADDYGRVSMRIEPPLVKNHVGASIRMRQTNSIRGESFLIKALVVDDVLDYTVDAAGYYRLRFKFTEALV